MRNNLSDSMPMDGTGRIRNSCERFLSLILCGVMKGELYCVGDTGYIE